MNDRRRPSAISVPFIDRTNERQLMPDYQGDVLVWDIDKTYLDTPFHSWRGLLAIPFEFAIDKRSIPGTVPLLRALRRGAGPRSALVPLYFVSGSPRELRAVIERKMTLDGVDFDGITFKDQLGLVRAHRTRELKAQLGYKLTALLLYRRELPHGARWLLFGDDVEADAQIFALFGEICAGLRDGPLRTRLAGLNVAPDHVHRIAELAETLPKGADPVERVFIHLASGQDPSRLEGKKTIATKSFLETALLLAAMERIRPEAISAVARDLRAHFCDEAEIERLVVDARLRLGVPSELLRYVAR